MTITRFFITLRRFGVRGVWNWCLRLFVNSDETLKALQKHVKKGYCSKRGVTVLGNLSGQHSLNKVLRDLCQSLHETGIPFQSVDITQPIPDDVVLNKYSHIVVMFGAFKLRGLKGCTQHRIVFWEFESGLSELLPELIDGSPILVFSQFCLESVSKQVSCPINLVRYPFHFEAPAITPREDVCKKYGIPTDAFVVFYNFDYSSDYYRKNPEGLLNAFIEAFRDQSDALLVFKTKGQRKSVTFAERFQKMATESAVGSRIRFINDYIPTEDLIALTASSDIYVSLHRGEGFGLGMAEAMSLGKAVVATDYGANREFCTSETAELVPYTMIKVPPEQNENTHYKWVREWPEPDVHAAATAMRKLYDDPEYRKSLGLRGQAFIKDHYSLANFKKSIEAFLER